MLLGVSVVVDADKQQVIRILHHLGRVLPALNLVDGGIGVLPELQLDDDGGRFHITRGQARCEAVPMKE